MKTILPKTLAISLPALAAATALSVMPAAAQEACGPTVAVQAGDTLSAIAERCGLSVDAVVAANPGVDPAALQVGQEINLSGEAVPAGGEAMPGDGMAPAPADPMAPAADPMAPAPDAGGVPIEPAPAPEPMPGTEPVPMPEPVPGGEQPVPEVQMPGTEPAPM